MLNGCSKKRPDVFFDLPGHCVIVEIDEHQHRSYEESCECARLCEIVSGIGGKPVIVIRFNPDSTRKAGRILPLELADKLDLLVATIKTELMASYDTFMVKLVQLYFDDISDATGFQALKEEDITDRVAL
jgi:Holliday junction resolvase